MMPQQIRFVSATRLTTAEFRRSSLLASSLHRLSQRCHFEADISYENKAGLPEVYNRTLRTCAGDEILVFVHDDCRLEDWFLPERLAEALQQFDIIGLAGNRRRVKRQTAWHWDGIKWDWQHFSGAVGYMNGTRHEVTHFGDCPAEVKLLDGLFLGAQADVLRGAGVEFDQRFQFHLYDIDFSRTCENAGLRLGTWPIAITHGSPSEGYETPEWLAESRKYLAKWPD